MFSSCADCGSDPEEEKLGDAVDVGEEETAEPEPDYGIKSNNKFLTKQILSQNN